MSLYLMRAIYAAAYASTRMCCVGFMLIKFATNSGASQSVANNMLRIVICIVLCLELGNCETHPSSNEIRRNSYKTKCCHSNLSYFQQVILWARLCYQVDDSVSAKCIPKGHSYSTLWELTGLWWSRLWSYSYWHCRWLADARRVQSMMIRKSE